MSNGQATHVNLFGDIRITNQAVIQGASMSAPQPCTFDGVKFSGSGWEFYPSDFADAASAAPLPVNHAIQIDWTERMIMSTGYPASAAMGLARLITAAYPPDTTDEGLPGWTQYWARVEVDRDMRNAPRSFIDEPVGSRPSPLRRTAFPLFMARPDRQGFAALYTDLRSPNHFGCIGAPPLDMEAMLADALGSAATSSPMLSARRKGCGPVRRSQLFGTAGEYVFAHPTPSGVRTVPLPRARLQAFYERQMQDRTPVKGRKGVRGRPPGSRNILTLAMVREKLRAAYGPLLADNPFAMQMHTQAWDTGLPDPEKSGLIDWRPPHNRRVQYMINPTSDGLTFMPLLPTPAVSGLPPGAISFVNPVTILMRRLVPQPLTTTPPLPRQRECYLIVHDSTAVDVADADAIFTKATLRLVVPEAALLARFDRALCEHMAPIVPGADGPATVHPLEALVLRALPHPSMSLGLPPARYYRRVSHAELDYIKPGDVVNCVYDKLYSSDSILLPTTPPPRKVDLDDAADFV